MQPTVISHSITTIMNTNTQKTMDLLPSVEFETQQNPDAAIVWLHGLGADGNDFAPIVPQLRLPGSLAVRFIFPHAPSIPVTINGGFIMPAWYDILEMNIDRKVDTAQLMQSAAKICNFVTRELERGISSKRIIIAGFSQGGAVTYQVALSSEIPVAGLLAMSSYFATVDTIKLSEVNKNIPIKIQHGIHDPVVPEALGQKATTQLVKLGYRVNYQNYPMEHAVCPQQISDISLWIQEILN